MFRFARCKRAMSVTLAAIIVLAAIFTGIALVGAESKGGDVLGAGGSGSVNLSSAVVSGSDSVFTGVIAEQKEVGKLTVYGNVDVSAYFGNIAIRIGSDLVRSQIFGVTPDATGAFETTFALNSFFCKEFGNSVPVTVCYGDKELVLGNVGVVIYDYETGILTYPENTYYVNSAEQQAELTTGYVPADALVKDGKVTVFFESKMFNFVPNTAPVADAPAKGNDGVYKQVGVDADGDGIVDYIKALLNVTAGREYAVAEVKGSIGADYGVPESAWMDASEAGVIENLVSGHKYTFWVRVKGDSEKLASAPVYLGSIIAMDSDEATSINAFLNKYNEVTVTNGHTLYPGKVTATADEVSALITLYNALSDNAKLNEDIVGKGDHLVISHYVAKYGALLDAAAAATKLDDIFGVDKYELAQAQAAYADFEANAAFFKANYLGEDDADFMVSLKKKVDTLFACSAIASSNLAADEKDRMVGVVDYLIDFGYDVYEGNANAYPENVFGVYAAQFAATFSIDYECIEIVEKYDLFDASKNSILSFDHIATEDLGVILEDLVAVTYSPLELNKSLIAATSFEYTERYYELACALDDKGDTEVKALIDNLKALYESKALELELEIIGMYDPTEDYETTVNAINVRFAYLDAVAKTTALKNGNAKIDAAVDMYLDGYNQLNGIWNLVVQNPNTYESVMDVIAEVLDRATKEVEFIKAVDKAVADITAMKNGDAQVDAAANSYIAVVNNLTFNYDNTANVMKRITDTVAAAQGETDFEKKRDESIVALTSNAQTYMSDDRYSAEGKQTIANMLKAACDSINALKYSDGKRVNDIDAEIFKALENFKSVKVIVAYVGSGTTYPDPVTELWGKITNDNGFSGALKLSIKVITDTKEFKASAGKVVTGTLNKEKEEAVIDGKELALAIKVSLSDGATTVSGTDNGNYTVKVFLPKELRTKSGLQVVAMDGDTAKIYDTVRAGAYLQFVVNDLSEEYYIIADKNVSLTWLVVVLAILVVIEIAVVIFFVIKKKKGATAAVFAPFLAIIYTPEGIIPAAIILAVIASVGAIASAVSVVKAVKKNTVTAKETDEPAEEINEVTEEAAAKAAPEVVEEVVTEEVIEEVVEEAAPEVVEEVAEEPAPETAAEEDETVTIVQADVEKEETVMPIVIPVDTDENEEDAALDNDADDDAGEDQKVFSGFDGSKIYVTYDYSFRSKLMLSTEEVQGRYALISDMLLSYGMKSRESWKKERYFFKGTTYANVFFRGKTLCVCLAIAPASLEGTKYFYEDVSSTKKYESVPVMVRVRSGRGCKYVLELIKMMFEGAGIEQKRAVSDSFTYRTATKDELIGMGFIKVLMSDGEGEAVAADFEALKNFKFGEGMPIMKVVTAEEVAVVPDEEVAQFIETEEEDDEEAVNGRRKGIVNIDSISAAFNDGDVVTLKSLKEKKLVAKNIDLVKILARGALDKKLTVKAHDFSMDAVKMIIITGGSVIKLKKKG